MPSVSVIIPNYNHAPYLKQRIDSVLEQTFQDFEVIILDDKSTDSSREVIEQYRNHPKVSHIVYNEENSGSTFKQWNKGIELAKREWIWIAESDDTAEPTLLQTLISGIKKEPDIVLAFCQSNRMDSHGKITGSWLNHTESHKRDFTKNFYADGKDLIFYDLIHRNVIPNASAVIFKKEAFLKAEKADEDIRYNSDWLLWMKILLFGNVCFSAEKLNNFRYHNQSVIASSSKNEALPFKRKYDIIMLERFVEYLNKFNVKTLVKPFSNQLCLFSEYEFRFLYTKGFRRASLSYLTKTLAKNPSKRLFLLRTCTFLLTTKK